MRIYHMSFIIIFLVMNERYTKQNYFYGHSTWHWGWSMLFRKIKTNLSKYSTHFLTYKYHSIIVLLHTFRSIYVYRHVLEVCFFFSVSQAKWWFDVILSSFIVNLLWFCFTFGVFCFELLSIFQPFGDWMRTSKSIQNGLVAQSTDIILNFYRHSSHTKVFWVAKMVRRLFMKPFIFFFSLEKTILCEKNRC